MAMNARLLRPRASASGFDPRSIAGLEIWIDGADRSTMFDATSGGSLVADGSAVARWEDKSGNGYHFTQGTANNRPTVIANAYNGRSALSFDGSNDILLSSYNPATLLPNSFTFACVFERSTSPNFPIVFGFDGGVTGAGRAIYLRSNSSYEISYGQNGNGVDGNIAASLNARFAVVVMNNNSNVSIFVNNVFDVSGTPASTAVITTTAFAVGGAQNGGKLGGRIYEAMLFSRTLSEQEVAALFLNQLMPKWGIA